jgi:phosphomannomutase/phosphoglucomutase
MGVKPRSSPGHDFRSYSASIKLAWCRPHGGRGQGPRHRLAMTPMAYFAQFDLSWPAVAMVTASA